MIRFLRVELSGLLLGFLVAGGNGSSAQATASTGSKSDAAKVSLTDVVRNLPDYMSSNKPEEYSQAFEDATASERDAAIPKLIAWLSDDRPRVRGEALLSIGLLYMGSEKHPEPRCNTFLSAEYVPLIAARLRDSDVQVRKVTFLALQSVESCGHGMDELVRLVVPMLHDPDILTEYPDPFFIESDKAMMARMTPERQSEFMAARAKMPVMKLPAEGPELLSILAFPTWQPTNDVDDAMIAFLDREDQTKSTLGDCLHTLALSRASERVNDEALRRVFEKKAMNVFLLQFVTQMRLTQDQLKVQKERLIAVSNDESERSSVRATAKTIAACWGVDKTGNCRPTEEEFQEDNRIGSAEHQPH